ncbi:ABC transporter ATP-binding protein [Schaalia sp. 19OD2882]|uniref:ABC transporter ATP-binding protein n=1 Tax=Schaalia sp. 19OD2882 TaxID=2794089 RepID=UPI001C1ED9DB|nr:ABC transporter ATP-binding protein [Schaalia sp. 19OD2882]QWW20269.1 ABC transporter ATP-binding protein [Schaalia sp. 19OD2882]
MKRLIDALRELLPLLPEGAAPFLWAYAISTSALSLLDVGALAILAMILTPMMTGATIHLPLFGQVGPSGYPWLLLLVCVLMILKAVFGLLIQWFATRRFKGFEMTVGDTLFDAYIRAPWTDRLSRSTAEIVRMADVGIANTISGVLMPAVTLPQQLVTFATILAVLLVAQPTIATITLVYLGIVAAIMYLGISRSAVVAGNVNLCYSLRITKLMTEMVGSLKEITLRDAFTDVARVVHDNREHSTRARANLLFLGAVPQRLVEAALVGGFLLVGGFAWWMLGPQEAFTSIALFAVAGFRIVPAIVSFQTVMTSTANSLPHLEAVLQDIRAAEGYVARAEVIGSDRVGDDPRELVLTDVSFTYPGADARAVDQVDLRIPMGSSLGIVGSSGSGKSTLVDILLGLLLPESGRIELDGRPLQEVLKEWRSRVGYVPQEVSLFDATIAQNIALTWGDDIDEERVLKAVEQAQLSSMVAGRPGGIHARIGERGIALSGGERQRLGIARALYVDPLVLVMDEATSALDTKTEDAVAEAIRSLHGQVTVISIAHRLSTIRHADQVCFMKHGSMTARGTFDELVAREPEFAVQAHLAGLVDATDLDFGTPTPAPHAERND